MMIETLKNDSYYIYLHFFPKMDFVLTKRLFIYIYPVDMHYVTESKWTQCAALLACFWS